MSFFSELQRRNVLKTAAAYVVVAWVIVEAAATLQEIFGFPIWIVQALTILLAIGLLPVLVFSWFYQLTPQGLVRDDGLDEDRSFAEATGRKLIYVTIAFAILGVVLIAGTRTEHPTPPPQPAAQAQTAAPDPLSVAVLPFRNMSANQANEYFADGLTETVIHMLAQVDRLRVPAFTTVMTFKDRDSDIRDIAATIGVANILEGSVQRDGDRVRVTAQLIRADDGTHLWSKNYDRTLTDIFAIQDDVASDVGITLLGSLLNPGDVVRPRGVDTASFAAYDLFLQARSERHIGSFEALRKSEYLLLAALEEDPDFVDARAEYASLLQEMGDTGVVSGEESLERMGEFLEEALKEDPTHPAARMLHLVWQAMQLGTRDQAERMPQLLREAREVHATTRHDIATSLNFVLLLRLNSEKEAAIAVLNDALEIDPLNPVLHFEIGRVYSSIGNHVAATKAFQRCLELEPEAPNTWVALGSEALLLGDGTIASDSFLRALDLDQLDVEMPGAVASLLYELRLVDEAQAFHDQARKMAPDSEEVQKLDILEAVARDEQDEALRLSWNVVEGDIGPRGSARQVAWRTILHLSARRGTEAQDIARIDQSLPGFADIEQADRQRVFKLNALDVLQAVNSRADLERMTTLIYDHYRGLGVQDADFPLVRLDVLILFHPLEEAVEWALATVFSKPPTAFYGQWMWRLRFSRPFMAPFFEDPRMRQALEEWENTEARIREEFKATLRARATESE